VTKLQETISLETRLKAAKAEFIEQKEKYKEASEAVYKNFYIAEKNYNDAVTNRDLYREKAKTVSKTDKEAGKAYFIKYRDWERTADNCKKNLDTATQFKEETDKNLANMAKREANFDSRIDQLKLIVSNLKANEALEGLINPSDLDTIKEIEEEVRDYEISAKAKADVRTAVKPLEALDINEAKDEAAYEEFLKLTNEEK